MVNFLVGGQDEEGPSKLARFLWRSGDGLPHLAGLPNNYIRIRWLKFRPNARQSGEGLLMPVT